jgi:hypothetical protein
MYELKIYYNEEVKEFDINTQEDVDNILTSHPELEGREYSVYDNDGKCVEYSLSFDTYSCEALFNKYEVIMDESLRAELEELRDLVWGKDIASPTCPEYIEHHRDIQEILKKLDVILDSHK